LMHRSENGDDQYPLRRHQRPPREACPNLITIDIIKKKGPF
jgi:hypothetical protein